MKVIKRDNSVCEFDRKKIVVALGKANAAVDVEDRITDAQINAIADDIAARHRVDGITEISTYEGVYPLSLRARAHP